MTLGHQDWPPVVFEPGVLADSRTEDWSAVTVIGPGETFDADRMKAYQPGNVLVLPGDTFHFHWAKSGEYMTQVTGIGRIPGPERRSTQHGPDGARMNELLARVLDAHGGLDRWHGYTRAQATIRSGGGLFPLKGVPQDPSPRQMTVWLHEERSSVCPYGAADQRTMLTPQRIAVEKLDGTVVAERRPPRTRSRVTRCTRHGMPSTWRTSTARRC